MPLLSLEDVTFGHSRPPLLEHVTLRVERGERIALLGRNGAGKSTLLKVLNEEIVPDGGEVRRQAGVRVARLVQEVPSGRGGTVGEIVLAGAGELTDHDARWRAEQQAERVMARMSLDPAADFEALSSGLKRRVLLARTLVAEPDVLLLDEPTNHLDVESITWLEGFLGRFGGTFLFVTHDRAFMRRLANRVIELERGRLFDWTCDYDTFLKRKEEALEAEAKQEALFDKKLAQEEAWIRQGVKARRTRNEGRVRALEELRRQHRARRKAVGTVNMQVQQADKSGRLVAEAKNVSFAYPPSPSGGGPRRGQATGDVDSASAPTLPSPGGGGKTEIVRDLSVTLMRGDKVGVLGPNGCGKTTLLRLLLGDLKPSSGTVRHGTNLEIAYFDQLRASVDEEKTVQENVGDGAEQILIDGKRRHVIGYLQDFLFTPDRARSPARFLSGGERNRLLLAKLFTKPSNVLVLDEPTNDLDTETLELLESLLVDYGGTVLLVSHDREFLDNVATSVLAFEGDGAFKEYEGGYADWLRGREAAGASVEESPVKSQPRAESPAKPKKLTFKEQKELDALPARIEALETEQQELHGSMADPTFFRQDGAKIAAATARLTALETELAAVYGRWEELEGRRET